MREFVLISPNEKFRKLLQKSSEQRARSHDFIFSTLSSDELNELTGTLLELETYLEKGVTLAELDADKSSGKLVVREEFPSR
ncbi:MAG: hypothetical protein GY844_31915 [Bradyrhizobium sp.]|nr:hypothetical protein [Bradyrhizobium sp.]